MSHQVVTEQHIGTIVVKSRNERLQYRTMALESTHLTSSVSVSSPLVQTTDSFNDSRTSLASHLSLRTLPAFRCLSLETIRPESSLMVRSGAVTQFRTRSWNCFIVNLIDFQLLVYYVCLNLLIVYTYVNDNIIIINFNFNIIIMNTIGKYNYLFINEI